MKDATGIIGGLVLLFNQRLKRKQLNDAEHRLPALDLSGVASSWTVAKYSHRQNYRTEWRRKIILGFNCTGFFQFCFGGRGQKMLDRIDSFPDIFELFWNPRSLKKKNIEQNDL